MYAKAVEFANLKEKLGDARDRSSFLNSFKNQQHSIEALGHGQDSDQAFLTTLSSTMHDLKNLNLKLDSNLNRRNTLQMKLDVDHGIDMGESLD